MQGMPCEAMHAENSLWVSHQGEPSIWLLLVGQRSFLGPNIRDAHLVDILQRMHDVIRLLYGSVQCLIDLVRPGIKFMPHLFDAMTDIRYGNFSVCIRVSQIVQGKRQLQTTLHVLYIRRSADAWTAGSVQGLACVTVWQEKPELCALLYETAVKFACHLSARGMACSAGCLRG